MTLANFQNSLSTLAPASIDKSASSPAGIMSPGLGPAELLRNCLLDWAPSGANKKLPPGLGPGSFLKKLQWRAVFLCQIEYGAGEHCNTGVGESWGFHFDGNTLSFMYDCFHITTVYSFILILNHKLTSFQIKEIP